MTTNDRRPTTNDGERSSFVVGRLPSSGGWSQQSVAIIGLGIEGGALARYFLRQGAQVTVHHYLPEDKARENGELWAQVETLRQAGVVFRFGDEYLEGLMQSDAIGVVQSATTYKYPRNRAALAEAHEKGIPIFTDMKLFFGQCPAPIIGVTGTNGKTTTTEMAERVLREGPAGASVHAAGNIGVSPLDLLPELTEKDLVLLELSNYQLEYLDRSPWIAAVTNLAPDHLVDYGGSFEAYIAAKRHILDFQTPRDFAVLNWDNPLTRGWAQVARGSVVPFSRLGAAEQGALVREGRIVYRDVSGEMPICDVAELQVRGGHNVENALAAAAIGALNRVPPKGIARALTSYRSGEHRVEFVGERNGVEFFNDSKSTTPASTAAAIRAFPGRLIVLLVGGRDKGLPWDELAALAAERVRDVVAFGEAAGLIEAEMRKASAGLHVITKPNLEAAFESAVRLARPGDVVLLSPACTSFDQFNSYAERGRRFKELVSERL